MIQAGTEIGSDGRLRRMSWVALWAAWPVTLASRVVIASGHPGLFWTVVQDCGLVVGNLALLGLGYCYWRRWRREDGSSSRRVLPSESGISRFLASRRNRPNS